MTNLEIINRIRRFAEAPHFSKEELLKHLNILERKLKSEKELKIVQLEIELAELKKD